MSTENNITREGLKVMSLLEQVSKQAAKYESDIADLRVELTVVGQERDAYKQQIEDAGVPTEEDNTSSD